MAEQDLFYRLGLVCFEGLLAFGCYRTYRNLLTEATTIAEAHVYGVWSTLHSAVSRAPGKCLPYVGIYGMTKLSEGYCLKGLNSPITGLIHKATIIEHKTEIIKDVRIEAKRIVSSFTKFCNFGILLRETLTGNSSILVEVNQPERANPLHSHLQLVEVGTFKAINEGTTKSLSKNKAEIIKGHEFKESMLPEGAQLLVLGKVFLSNQNGKPELCIAPSDSGPYILTNGTKSELSNELYYRAKFFKFLFYSILVGGAITLVSFVENK